MRSDWCKLSVAGLLFLTAHTAMAQAPNKGAQRRFTLERARVELQSTKEILGGLREEALRKYLLGYETPAEKHAASRYWGQLSRVSKLPSLELIPRPKVMGLNPYLMPNGVPDVPPLYPTVGDLKLGYVPTFQPGGVDDTGGHMPRFPPGTDSDRIEEIVEAWTAVNRRLTLPERNAVVRLIYRGSDNCSGVLVTPNWVITAGHCVSFLPTHVGVGETFQGQLEVGVAQCELHPMALKSQRSCGSKMPKSTFKAKPFDLALLRLDRSVPPSVAVPATVLLDNNYPGGLAKRFARMVGFGTIFYSGPGSSYVAPKLRQQGPGEFSVEDGHLRVASTTLAYVASGDSGGASFLACDAASPRPELLAGLNVDIHPTNKNANVAPFVDPMTKQWLRRHVKALEATELGQCLEPTPPGSSSTTPSDCDTLPLEEFLACLGS